MGVRAETRHQSSSLANTSAFRYRVAFPSPSDLGARLPVTAQGRADTLEERIETSKPAREQISREMGNSHSAPSAVF